MKVAGEFQHETARPNEMWQIDFTHFKIIGWGWMYLSVVLDDISSYVIACKLCSAMRAEGVTDTLDLALAASGCDQATVMHKPRLLRDNGPRYIAGELAEYIEARAMTVCAAPRFIRRLKARSSGVTGAEEPHPAGKLLPAQRSRGPHRRAFVEHYDHQRYHESLDNVTPVDAILR